MPSQIEQAADEVFGRGAVAAPGRFFTPVAFGEGETISEQYRARKNLAAEETAISSLIAKTATNVEDTISADRNVAAMRAESDTLKAIEALDPYEPGFRNAAAQFSQMAGMSGAVRHALDQKVQQYGGLSENLQQLTTIGVAAGLSKEEIDQNNRTAADLLRRGDVPGLMSLLGRTGTLAEGRQRQIEFEDSVRLSQVKAQLDDARTNFRGIESRMTARGEKLEANFGQVPPNVRNNPEHAQFFSLVGEDQPRVFTYDKTFTRTTGGKLSADQRAAMKEAGFDKKEIDDFEQFGGSVSKPQTFTRSAGEVVARDVLGEMFFGAGFTDKIDPETGEVQTDEDGNPLQVPLIRGLRQLPEGVIEEGKVEAFEKFVDKMFKRAWDGNKNTFVAEFTEDLADKQVQEILRDFREVAGDDALLMELVLGNVKEENRSALTKQFLEGLYEEIQAIKDIEILQKQARRDAGMLQDAEATMTDKEREAHQIEQEEGERSGVLGPGEQSDIPDNPEDPNSFVVPADDPAAVAASEAIQKAEEATRLPDAAPVSFDPVVPPPVPPDPPRPSANRAMDNRNRKLWEKENEKFQKALAEWKEKYPAAAKEYAQQEAAQKRQRQQVG